MRFSREKLLVQAKREMRECGLRAGEVLTHRQGYGNWREHKHEYFLQAKTVASFTCKILGNVKLSDALWEEYHSAVRESSTVER